MSDYENWNGKLILLEKKDGEDLYDQKKRLCIEEGYDPEGCDEDTFNDCFYDTLIILGEDIYKVDGKDNEAEDGTHCRITKNDKGELEFSARFYNSGTYLFEMLREAWKEKNGL